ncbi:hypothetical protein ABW19_dt0204084 [Dactylella cylindrospora]|nr:hypothetical protein ABW19_dt0204084 [Dactylella cylindrospora]
MNDIELQPIDSNYIRVTFANKDFEGQCKLIQCDLQDPEALAGLCKAILSIYAQGKHHLHLVNFFKKFEVAVGTCERRLKSPNTQPHNQNVDFLPVNIVLASQVFDAELTYYLNRRSVSVPRGLAAYPGCLQSDTLVNTSGRFSAIIVTRRINWIRVAAAVSATFVPLCITASICIGMATEKVEIGVIFPPGLAIAGLV